MKSLSTYLALALAFTQPEPPQGLNILLTNDDGWGTANIRAVYNHLTAAGHNVVLSGPVHNQSGMGNKEYISGHAHMKSAGEFDLVHAGEPSVGYNSSDPSYNYIDGTPASSALYGLDVLTDELLPLGESFDLVVSGVNYGNNLGGTFKISGTCGAAYTSVSKGVPAIALSAAYGNTQPYKRLDSASKDHPSNIYGRITADIVSRYIDGLITIPDGFGLNVNFPKLTDDCKYPHVLEQTTVLGNKDDEQVSTALRFTVIETDNELENGRYLPKFNETSPDYIKVIAVGNSTLLSESELVRSSSCKSSASYFYLDGIDAPTLSKRKLELQISNKH